nr:hypothetical protein [Tanacetum cinerariifolium]
MDTPLFDGMLVLQQAQDVEDPAKDEDDVNELKQRVRRLEKKRQFKSSRLKRLRKVGTTQRVESLADTVMDDQEDASKQGEIAELDADKDGRLEESQAKVYHLDLEHAEKVPSMQDTNEAKPAKVEEVIEVVSTAKLMTKVVTTTATTITTAQVPKDSALRKRRGVVIQDLEETATTSVIVHSKVKSKDKEESKMSLELLRKETNKKNKSTKVSVGFDDLLPGSKYRKTILATARAMIDVFSKKITLRVGDDEIIFNVDQSIKRPPNEDDECYVINDLDDTITMETQELLAKDKFDSFLLKGLEKLIDQSDLETYESLGNKSDNDFDIDKPIRRINSSNTPYSVA